MSAASENEQADKIIARPMRMKALKIICMVSLDMDDQVKPIWRHIWGRSDQLPALVYHILDKIRLLFPA